MHPPSLSVGERHLGQGLVITLMARREELSSTPTSLRQRALDIMSGSKGDDELLLVIDPSDVIVVRQVPI